MENSTSFILLASELVGRWSSFLSNIMHTIVSVRCVSCGTIAWIKTHNPNQLAQYRYCCRSCWLLTNLIAYSLYITGNIVVDRPHEQQSLAE